MIRYCLPLLTSSWRELQERLSEEASGYDVLEFWLDGVADLQISHVQELAELYQEKALFLFRRTDAQPMRLDPAFRKEVMEIAAKYSCRIDCDIRTQDEDLQVWKSLPAKPKLIASFHNYHECPSYEDLSQILFTEMAPLSAEILKISVFCKNPVEAQSLLRLAEEAKQKNMKIIILGMGEYGAVTRIFGTLWYNEMIFAPALPKYCSAPGQITKSQLENIFSILGQS